LRVIERKPIRPLERQRMRPWLLEILNSGDCQQLAWYNRKVRTFRVSWKHAAGQTFDPCADATLFQRWATHTGTRNTNHLHQQQFDVTTKQFIQLKILCQFLYIT